jgi:hypothetical protein
MTREVFDEPFRNWMADRVCDFSQALKSGKDPEVTFEVAVEGLPKMVIQVRLMDCEGVYTREEITIETVLEWRK